MTNEAIIGTRGSKLALWQAEWVKTELERRYPGLKINVKKIKTSGDKMTDVPLAKVGGKGLFVKEIEEALLAQEIDLAVHSMKDVPTLIPEGLHFPVVTAREDARDVLISQDGKRLEDLPQGSRLGTSSLRRMAQLCHLRPDLVVLPLRGNLDTRLRKLKAGEVDAIVVAAAGMKRLGWENEITEYLSPEICLPAIGQGALGVESRKEDMRTNSLIAPLNDKTTHSEVKAERAVLIRLEGGCQVPIAAHATISCGTLRLRGLVASVNGRRIIHAEETENSDRPAVIGKRLAQRLLDQGAGEILEEIFG